MALQLYKKHLQRIGLAMVILTSLFFIVNLAVYLFDISSIKVTRTELITEFIDIITGITILLAARSKNFRFIEILPTLLLTILSDALSIRNGGGLDAIANTKLPFVALAVYTFYQINHVQLQMDRILKGKMSVLDLRIGSRDELFDPLVISPHPEVNSSILHAVDNFLSTAKVLGPISVQLHCREQISDALWDTFTECFRLHYEDEERRVRNYLDSRYSRIISLAIISIFSLMLWSSFGGDNSSTGTVWVVFGNLAAFSLWQTGSTHFERNDAYQDLAKIRIAGSSELRLLRS